VWLNVSAPQARGISDPGGQTCDSWLGYSQSPVWYRVEEGWDIATKSTGEAGGLCGSSINGWYAGTIPARYATETGPMCWAYWGSTCYYSSSSYQLTQSVQVTNCGSYFVWYLHTLSNICYSSWCVEPTPEWYFYVAPAQIGEDLPEQCTTYTDLASSGRKISDPGGQACDYNSYSASPVWYRIEDGYDIATKSTGEHGNHCGSAINGWYAGTVPAPYETETGPMCWSYWGSTCYNVPNYCLTQSVQVTNCGSYLVWRLQTLTSSAGGQVCSSGWCVEPTPAWYFYGSS